MKVSLLTYEFPPRIYGGAGVHVLHMASQLRHMVDLEVRTLHPAEDMEGVRIRRYYPTLPKGPEDREGKAVEVLSLNVNIVADPFDTDVVHTHTWYMSFAGMVAKRLYDTKLVATVHSLEPLRPWKEEQLGRGYRLSSWVEENGLGACDAVVAVSEEMSADIQKHYGIPAERVHVIPNGVDATAYRRREDPSVLERLGVEVPYILFLGRLSRQKGIFDLVEAFKALKAKSNLVLVTGPADTTELVDELSEALRGLAGIRWINRMVTHEEAVALYSSCEVFVCPSRYEPFGIINLEAMACERPVVATEVGGIAGVVRDGKTGVLVPPEDPRALAKAIDTLMADSKLREDMGKKGRMRVEKHFTWKTVAERTVELYRSLL